MWTKLHSFLSIPVIIDENDPRRAIVLIFLVIFSIGLNALFIVTMMIAGQWRYLLPGLLSLGAFFFAWGLIRLKKIELAAWFFLILFLFGALSILSAAGLRMVTDPVLIVLIVPVIVIAGLLLGWKVGSGFSVVIALLVVSLACLEKIGHLSIEMEPGSDVVLFSFLLVIVYVSTTIGLNDYLVKKLLNRAHQELAERQRTEIALRESEMHFRSLLENIPAITYLIGVGQEPLNPTLYISPQIVKLSNYTSEEFMKDPQLWTRLIHPDDLARVMALSEYGDRAGESLVSDYRIIDHEQKTHWIHDENILVRDDDGQPLYRVGVWTDITERQQVEFARQQVEGIYRRAIMAAGAVPYVLDHSTRTFTFVGEGILSMTGYSAAEMMSTNYWSTMVQEGFPRGNLAHLTYEEADHLTEEDNSIPWECDFRIRTRDGQTRWIADTSVKSVDENSGHILSIGIKQDITARKEAEENIRRLNETLEARVAHRTAQLEAANQELEAFSYSVSHDLRAPLRAVNSFARIIKDDFSASMDPLGLGFLDKVIASGAQMNQLIDGLLDFSRTSRQELNRQIVDFNRITHAVIESLAPEIGSRQIEWNLGDLPSAPADPTLINVNNG